MTPPADEPPWPSEGGLFAFLRRWAWPFEEGEDLGEEGSAFTYWTRENGFGEGAAAVFRFDGETLELKLDVRHPRRLALTASEVDAFAPALARYVEGASPLETLLAAHPAARALLAIYREAADEADLAAPPPPADGAPEPGDG